MLNLNDPKVIFSVLIRAKDQLHDVYRQEFIGGKLSIKERTYTSKSGELQLALLESGDVVRRQKAA